MVTYKFNPFTGNLDLVSEEDLSGYVPYSGATGDVDLGVHGLTAGALIGDSLVIDQISIDNNIYSSVGVDLTFDTGGDAIIFNHATTKKFEILVDKNSTTQTLAPGTDNAIDLGIVGATDFRFRHLYLAGNLSDETNTLTIANAKTAYDHSQDNTQAHTDYLLNNASDTFSGNTLTLSGSASTTGLTINNTAFTGDPVIQLQLSGATKAMIGIDDSAGDAFMVGVGSRLDAVKGLNITTSGMKINSILTLDKVDLRYAQGSLSVNDTTPKIGGYNHWFTANTAATTITDFDAGVSGSFLKIICNDTNTTIADNANIHLNGSANFVMARYDTLSLNQLSDGIWHETGRMVR